MCAGVSFKLQPKKTIKKRETTKAGKIFDNKFSESKEEESSDGEEYVVEHVEEYSGFQTQGLEQGNTAQHSTDISEVGKGNLASSLSQVLRRNRRQRNGESEEEIFKRELEAAANESSREDYEQLPVEEFGKYMLEKMGWTGDEYREVEKWQYQARPSRLGLGATLPASKSK
eukprot:jgi/Galph1/5225/GphlegSOOS_G3885.1